MKQKLQKQKGRLMSSLLPQKWLMSLLTLLLFCICGGSAWADETFGFSMTHNQETMSMGNPELKTIDGVTISSCQNGSTLNPYLNSTNVKYFCWAGEDVKFSSTNYWRKTEKTTDYTDNQWVGYTLKVDNSGVLNISHVNARIMIEDTDITWKVVILNGGQQIWSSDNITTTKQAHDKLVDVNVSLSNLTGEVQVRIYVYQDGGTKYFNVNELQVTGNFQQNTTTSYNYSVVAKHNGNVLKTVANGTAEGDMTVYYPRYVLSGNNLYGIPANSSEPYWGVTVTADNPNKELNYSEVTPNVVFYIEGEDIDGARAIASGNRHSNGKYGNTFGQEKVITNLAAGSYKIHGRYSSGNNGDTFNATFKVDGKDIVQTFGKNWGQIVTSDVFTVTKDNSPVSFNVSNGNATGCDYILIERIPEVKIITQPLGGIVKDGMPDPLTIEATCWNNGNTTPTYLWYGSPNADGSESSAIDWATGSSFRPNQTGYYYCEVSNGIETIKSNVVYVSTAQCNHNVSSPTIGSTNFSEDGWWTNFSPFYELKKGEQLEFSFVNHSDMAQLWNNWILVVNNVKAHTKEEVNNINYKEYLVLRADNYGWATAYATPNMFKDGKPASEWTEGEWNEFKEEMAEAPVNVKISMSADGTRLYVYAKTVVNGKTYVMTENTNAFAATSSVNVFFTAEKAYLTDFQLVSTKKAYKVYTYNFTGGTAEVTNEDGLPVPAEGVYMGVGEHIYATPKPAAGYAFKEWGNGTTDVPRTYTVENADIGVWCTMIQAGFSQSELEVQLLDLTNAGLTFSGATYSSSNNKIAVVDPNTGALTLLKPGICSINGTINGQTYSYQLKVKADDANYTVTSAVVGNNTKYTYTVTSTGKLQSNYVSEIPGIEVKFGSDGETPIVRNVRSGFGVAVIGAEDGYKGSLIPNKDPMAGNGAPTTGTYYTIKPTINGVLTLSGYASGGHHVSLIEVDGSSFKEVDNYGFGGNTNELSQSNEFTIIANKTYYVVERLNSSTGSDGYFALKSFSFTPTLKFDVKGEILTKQTYYELAPQQISGLGAGQSYSYKVTVVKDAGSNLSVTNENVASNGKIQISSPTDADGGSVIVQAVIDGNPIGLAYVLTVPYIGNHTWNFHNLQDKQEKRTDAHWYLTYEVRLPHAGGVKDPIVVIQDKIDKDNAALIDETNGLTISTNNRNNSLGLAVVQDEIDNTDDDTRLAATIADVRQVSLVAVKGATLTIPAVKHDWFVKIYLDPHTGNATGHGSGSEFTVTNLDDLTGKYIDPSHVIRSYGTQWTRSTSYDDKTSNSPYAGCLIFRAHADGDVTFNFTNDGWDKIVKVEVSDTYSTEMELASNGSRIVDYLRWNHNWVHRVHTDAQGKEYGDGVSFYYNGDASAHAENAKLIDHKVICVDGKMNVTLDDHDWKSKRGADYRQANLTAGLDGSTTDKRNGVGNIKLLSNATYVAYENNGSGKKINAGTADTIKYVLNSKETWLVVGKLKVQNYPYTWDFDTYHMSFNGTMNDADRSVTKMALSTRNHPVLNTAVASDTTYGYWNNGKTNHLKNSRTRQSKGVTIPLLVCSSNEYADEYSNAQTSPFYKIVDGKKVYDRPIYKPLFANGSQLTYGFDPIPETEGLGISINQAYVTYSGSYPDYNNIHEEQITLDGQKLQINGTKYTITIPEVPAGMYVFVSSSAAPTSYTNLKTSDVEFAAHDKVYYYQVDKFGDVLLNFDPYVSIKRIGVTDQVKEINAYGYSTESRKIDIDHNETSQFSANVQAYFVGSYNKNSSTVTETQVAPYKHIQKFTGVLLHDDLAGQKRIAYNIPLFVPACNIIDRADNASNEAVNNKMLPTTTADNTTSPRSVPTIEGEYTNYTLANLHGTVVDGAVPSYGDDNTIGFYKFYGASVAQNKSYLHLPTSGLSDTSKVKGFVFLPGSAMEDDFTGIKTVEVSVDDDAEYYTISGMKLKGAPTKGGVYIKNGQKVYVK